MGRIEVLLTAILRALDKPKLGFHNSQEGQGVVYVFCNRQHEGCNWYTLNNGVHVPIHHTSLTGYLIDFKFEKTERDNKESTKLRAMIQCDQTIYTLEAGYKTFFTFGFLMAIASITSEDLLYPITIQPYPGDRKSVLFCKILTRNGVVTASYDDDTNWRNVAKKARDNVRGSGR